METSLLPLVLTSASTLAVTILTQIVTAYIERNKIKQQHDLEIEAKKIDDIKSRNKYKLEQLAKIWELTVTARYIISDIEILKVEGQLLPPKWEQRASYQAQRAYAIALIEFPEIRPFVRDFYEVIVKIEVASWWDKTDNVDSLIPLMHDLSLSISMEIDKMAKKINREDIV